MTTKTTPKQAREFADDLHARFASPESIVMLNSLADQVEALTAEVALKAEYARTTSQAHESACAERDAALALAAERLAYRMGHIDARHAAAALVVAVPPQEPVGWELVVKLLVASGNIEQSKVDEACEIAGNLPQAQPAADLTDDEIWEIGKTVGNRVDGYDDGLEFARAVLAAQKGKQITGRVG